MKFPVKINSHDNITAVRKTFMGDYYLSNIQQDNLL